jgi:hypothetical protein
VIYPLEDQFYGERGGRLRDPFGQQWMMSQHIEDVSAEEMAAGLRPSSANSGETAALAWLLTTRRSLWSRL